MKAVKTWMDGLLVMMMLGAGAAGAAEVAAGGDLYSAYVWRGITLNDGLVAQPSMDVSVGGFNFNVWGNFDIDDYDDALDVLPEGKEASDVNFFGGVGMSVPF